MQEVAGESFPTALRAVLAAAAAILVGLVVVDITWNNLPAPVGKNAVASP
eukprot:CAMPEP_0178580888 /NCGR_PEP_ID=MMETSP0697-20121206/22869_1 /TAXON_ID=265572 /ORGANISM="Extubocellulus spinifer, Strain CCMP396" /LENGTH=49 /DNA_ID= /DNA_START= /DNA_END= /DNA_ORIENTATION=